jgi:hypothetical protein
MADVKKIERWQCYNPCELEWAKTADHEHLSPPGRLCALCPGGPAVVLLIFDPHCLAKPHSHPGNIIYIVREGQMTIPGEGVDAQGDVRWAAKDYAYGPEVMGAKGPTLIAIQKDVPLAANWNNGSEGVSAQRTEKLASCLQFQLF